MRNILTRRDYTASFAPAFAGATLDWYKIVDEATHAVSHAVADFIKGGLTLRKSILLYGPPGSGKTLLACTIFNELGSQLGDRRLLGDVHLAGTADNIVWVRGNELPSKWTHKSDDADPRTGAAWTYHLQTAGLAVLDDIDKCPTQDNWAGQLFGLIDSRLVEHRLPTVITMNSTPAEFVTRYGQNGMPIVDRIKRNGGVFVRVPKVNFQKEK